MKTRNQFIDVVKGVTIVLVILAHCIQHGSGQAYKTQRMFFQNDVFQLIYSFHMPLFMLVSGYLFGQTLPRYSFNEQLIRRVKTLVIPLVMWSLFGMLLWHVMHPNEHALFWRQKQYLSIILFDLWFLWSVFFSSLIVLVVHQRYHDDLLLYGVIFLLTFITPDTWGAHLHKFMYPFFVIGYLGRCYHDTWLAWYRRHYKTLVVSSLLLFGCLLSQFNYHSFIYTSCYTIIGKQASAQIAIDLFRMTIGFVGSFVALVVLDGLFRRQIKPFNWLFGFLGRYSLGLYIVSGYFFMYAVPALTAGLPGIRYSLVCLQTLGVIVASLFITYLIERISPLRRLLFGGR